MARGGGTSGSPLINLPIVSGHVFDLPDTIEKGGETKEGVPQPQVPGLVMNGKIMWLVSSESADGGFP